MGLRKHKFTGMNDKNGRKIFDGDYLCPLAICGPFAGEKLDYAFIVNWNDKLKVWMASKEILQQVLKDYDIVVDDDKISY